MQQRAADGIIEYRGGRYIQGPDGKMQGSLPAGGSSAGGGDPKGSLLDPKNLDAYLEPRKTKYAKSPQKNRSGVQVGAKKYGQLRGIMKTQYQNTKAGEKLTLNSGKFRFYVTSDGEGGLTVNRVVKVRSIRKRGKK